MRYRCGRSERDRRLRGPHSGQSGTHEEALPMGPTISRRDFRTGRDNGLPSFNQRVNTFSGDTRPTNNTFPGIRATATSWFAGCSIRQDCENCAHFSKARAPPSRHVLSTDGEIAGARARFIAWRSSSASQSQCMCNTIAACGAPYRMAGMRKILGVDHVGR
jgi:hypothetical protein